MVTVVPADSLGRISYERMDASRSVPILGCDVSAGLSRDASTICVIDSRTSRVTATFECNYISTIEFAAVIQEIVTRWMPNAVINIERNGVAYTAIAAYRAICRFLGLIATKWVKSSIHHNVICKDKRDGCENRKKK